MSAEFYDFIERAEKCFKAADASGRFQGWMPHQLDAFEKWNKLSETTSRVRACLYYATGKGKTQIMLAMMFALGYVEVLVVAPPVTHNAWKRHAAALGLEVQTVSHAKFRQKEFTVSRSRPIIVDEFHLLGGQTGMGWKKFDRMMSSLEAPVVIGSATPNYNDAERVYCVAHALDPANNRGGFIGWLYAHCETTQNPFGSTPNVEGFYKYQSAEHFLSSLPYVIYVADEAPDILVEYPVHKVSETYEFEDLHINRAKARIMASIMEINLSTSLRQLVDEATGELTEHFAEALGILDGDQIFSKKVNTLIIFANRSTVAKAILARYKEGFEVTQDDNATREQMGASVNPDDEWYWSHGYVDGSMTTGQKLEITEAFVRGEFRVLIGTASIATGADGMDKMCDSIIIADDTPDNSLRRQLVGRILPRGVVDPEDYKKKTAYRIDFRDDPWEVID